MKFAIKETTLTDGSKVFDVDLFANGQWEPTFPGKAPICIFSCTSEIDADRFFRGLDFLIKKHTLEILEEA